MQIQNRNPGSTLARNQASSRVRVRVRMTRLRQLQAGKGQREREWKGRMKAKGRGENLERLSPFAWRTLVDDEAGTVLLSLAFCNQSDCAAFRIEKAKIRFISRNNRETLPRFRKLVSKDHRHVSARS